MCSRMTCHKKRMHRDFIELVVARVAHLSSHQSRPQVLSQRSRALRAAMKLCSAVGIMEV